MNSKNINEFVRKYEEKARLEGYSRFKETEETSPNVVHDLCLDSGSKEKNSYKNHVIINGGRK